MKKLLFIFLLMACQLEHDPTIHMKPPVVVKDIDTSSKAQPVVTLKGADEKIRKVISKEIAFSKNVGDTIK